MTLALRLVVAGVSGWAAYLSYAPHGIWVAGILAMAGLWWSMSWRQPSLRVGAATGCVHALVMYLFALPWIGELVGNFPYIALSVFLALYALVLGIGGAAVARWRYGFLVFALLYVAVEYARSSFPVGGFAWVRLAWGQVDGPLAGIATLGGPALVSFATVVVGSALASLFLHPPREKVVAGIAIVVPVATGVMSTTQLVNAGPATGDVRVAAIQGNVPRLGLEFNAQRRAVLANHVRVTEDLAQRENNIDLVFWPENSSDVNPFADRQAFQAITRAVEEINAPTLVGTITRDKVGDRNTMQVFDPVTGPGEFHNKKYLQPFGEYMPYRDFFRKFSHYVDLAGDFKPGDGPGVVHMGPYTVGVATCFEVIVDEAYHSAVLHGAQILTTPTNNATFGFSDMTYQQLAMSRLRAIETDRAVVVAATSGVSAIVYPDGTVAQSSDIFTADALVDTLPLKTTVTPAVRYGSVIQWVLTILGVVLTGIAVVSCLRARRRTRKS